jgi:BirA family biotin operon repressor/biotin-[acetyl-CoA-carboxylase] ligase
VLKPLHFSLLDTLSDGRFHSGEALALQFACSRSAIWQAIQHLNQAGVAIAAIRGRGYQLGQRFDRLDTASLRTQLQQWPQSLQLHSHDQLASTNQTLLKLEDQSRHGCVVLTEWQSAGRGRRGRHWQAPLGSGLTFSLGWQFQFGAAQLSGLSLAIGLGIVDALHSLGVIGAQLKWPNDIVCPSGKLGGVLIELSGDALGPSLAVIGIGLNVRLPKQPLAGVEQTVADLSQLGYSGDRASLLTALLHELVKCLSAFAEQGFEPVRERWQFFHAHQQQAVQLTRANGDTLDGIAIGVDASGALLLASGHEVHSIHAGEVSLRRQRS